MPVGSEPSTLPLGPKSCRIVSDQAPPAEGDNSDTVPVLLVPDWTPTPKRLPFGQRLRCMRCESGSHLETHTGKAFPRQLLTQGRPVNRVRRTAASFLVCFNHRQAEG